MIQGLRYMLCGASRLRTFGRSRSVGLYPDQPRPVVRKYRVSPGATSTSTFTLDALPGSQPTASFGARRTVWSPGETGYRPV